MNRITGFLLALDTMTYKAATYDYERIGSLKIDWLGLILIVLLIIAVATFIRGVIKQRAARRFHDVEK